MARFIWYINSISTSYSSDIRVDVYYFDDWISFRLPDNTNISYCLTNKTLSYGDLFGESGRERTVKVLDTVEYDDYSCGDVISNSIAIYDYETLECFLVDEVGVGNGSYATDARVYALISRKNDEILLRQLYIRKKSDNFIRK